jgi:uncharacterized protein YndB with AHSA1/START domain
MNNYRCQLLLTATPAAVYLALTTSHGLQQWWTPTCETDSVAGGRASFRFDSTHKAMRIERLVPGREVAWQCVEAHIDAPDVQHKDEWVGTHIVFRLAPTADGSQTRLDFEHIGLTPALECFDVCRGGWDQFLASLQAWVETGRGRPFVPAATATAG